MATRRSDVRAADASNRTATLSVLIPVFNERATVATSIEAVLEAKLPVRAREVIVVDDGSTDGTHDVLRNGSWPSEVRILSHPRNLGKGAAIQTALRHAQNTYTTIMDSDLEYDADDIGLLLEPLLAGESAVFGARGFQAHSSYSFWYVVGNKTVTLVANLLYNSWVADIMTCHKAVRTDLFQTLPLREAGFAIEAEITARLLQAGVRIYEVPISYRARSREEGKKLTPRDGLRVLRTLIRCRWV
ncbi:MAG: glycosyltransferase family 2 protein [Solirubrobacteraceae bacterium]|jgi:dolichol-phosphate hexosyltransferase